MRSLRTDVIREGFCISVTRAGYMLVTCKDIAHRLCAKIISELWED